MSQLERLPSNALSNEVINQQRVQLELKGAAQPRGSRSVMTYRIFSASTYDFQFTASSTPGTTIFHQADIEFLPADMTLGGAFCWRVYARIMDTSNNVITWIPLHLERRITNDGKQKWSIYHITFGYPGDTVRMKLYFFTNGAGTFSVNVII